MRIGDWSSDVCAADLFNSREKVKTKDMQFGGALGGPIIKDIAHFFVTYEGKRQQVPVEITPGANFTISYFPIEYQGYFGTTNRPLNDRSDERTVGNESVCTCSSRWELSY